MTFDFRLPVMDSNITSSFIPTDTARAAQGEGTPALYDLFLLVSVVALIASGALAAGVFFYTQYLDQAVTQKTVSLQRAKAAFDPSRIQDLTRLSDRLHAGDAVLQEHLAPSGFFRLLESSTLTTIAFSSLSFDATNPANITVKMPGVAESVNSIALQADVFTKGGALSNPIFSNIARRADGVHFDLVAIVNPSLVKYTQVHAAPVAQPQTDGFPQGAGIPAPLPSN